VVVVDTLEDLVESLGHKCPEVVHRAEVKNLVWCMYGPVVIGRHVTLTVDLCRIVSYIFRDGR